MARIQRDWKSASGVDEAETRGRAQWIDLARASAREPTLAWLGHASFSLGWQDERLLVDPVFKSWIGWFHRKVPSPDSRALAPSHRTAAIARFMNKFSCSIHFPFIRPG